MVITVASRDEPGVVLYSFSKVGDSVCIGRDKRKCKIALGVNAEGVSRIHLKLELLPNGRLLARDTSTYGTGYDGGPFKVEKEKELKPVVVLQIGSFYFIIEEKNDKEKSINETIGCSSQSIAETCSRKRLASRKSAVVVEEECVTKKKKLVDTALAKLTIGMNDSECVDESIENGKLVAKWGRKTKEKMISSQQSSLPEKCTSLHERSATGKNDITTSHAGQSNSSESQRVTSERKIIATRLTSWLNIGPTKKRSNHPANQNDENDVMVASKLVEIDVIEDENKKQEPEKSESSDGSREVDVSIGETDQTLGMNIETFRMKLRKAVQYEDLQRPVLPEGRSQSNFSRHQEVNYKRFTKAAQGTHVGCGLSHSMTKPIVSGVDLVDFREIA